MDPQDLSKLVSQPTNTPAWKTRKSFVKTLGRGSSTVPNHAIVRSTSLLYTARITVHLCAVRCGSKDSVSLEPQLFFNHQGCEVANVQLTSHASVCTFSSVRIARQPVAPSTTTRAHLVHALCAAQFLVESFTKPVAGGWVRCSANVHFGFHAQDDDKLLMGAALGHSFVKGNSTVGRRDT